jgi:uncharacterized protein
LGEFSARDASETDRVASQRIAFELPDGGAVCGECRVADSFIARLRGLMLTSTLPTGHGVLFTRTRSIHTHFMRFPIDAVFLDAENQVVSVAHRLAPWRGAASRRARAVLELAAGECERLGITRGTRLVAVTQ